MSLRAVLDAFADRGIKRTSRGWEARCPAHDDQKASLGIAEGEGGRVVLKCLAGCEVADVMAALGLPMSELFADQGPQRRIVATYDYRDESGALLYQVVRYEPKDFRQRRPEGGGWAWNMRGVRRVPYRLPELVAADPSTCVFFVEGEKDVESLARHGFLATTTVMGAKSWRAGNYREFFTGRNVVILPDNDSAGADYAAEVANTLDGAAASVKILRLPGLPAKGDVSDWFANGGTADELRRLTLDASQVQHAPSAFVTSAERLSGEREDRIACGPKALSFGVQFLDDAIGGILPKDLILLGAKTGVGKTALATMLALHNVQHGKRVHYFALEAEEIEIERRMKFQVLATEYYRAGNTRPLRYLDWYMGRLDSITARFEEEAEERLRTQLKNLLTFYRFKSFTSDDFVERLEVIKSQTDLVILDHLHYMDNDDENENRGYKHTVKQIRDSALESGRPIVVVAHVRKGDRRYETLVPGVEDFHGSSDISKIATKAIMLAPAYDRQNGRAHLLSTYMQVAKCRLDNSVTRYVALVTFNAQKNAYEDDYFLGRLINGGREFKYLTGDEMPVWSRARCPVMPAQQGGERR